MTLFNAIPHGKATVSSDEIGRKHIGGNRFGYSVSGRAERDWLGSVALQRELS